MSGKVIPLGNVTRLDIPPDQVLEGAVGKMQQVILIGYDNDGNHYFASSLADGGDCLWLVEQFKKALLDVQI